MAKKKVTVEPFVAAAGDPLAAEHAMVLRWVGEALGSLPGGRGYETVDLKSLPGGRAILEAGLDQARRLVLAGVAQVRHWDAQGERVRSQGKNENERLNAHSLPGWEEAWAPRRQTATVLFALMRRALPFEKEDLIALQVWCGEDHHLSSYYYPLGAIVKAIQRYASRADAITPPLRDSMTRFAAQLRSSHEKSIRQLATVLEQLLASGEEAPEQEEEQNTRRQPPPKAAPAGDPRVLDQLKRHCGVAGPAAEAAVVETLEPDQFSMRTDTPLQKEHRLLSGLFREVIGRPDYAHPPLAQLKAGKVIGKMDAAGRGRLLLAAAERATFGQLDGLDYSNSATWQSWYAAVALMHQVAAMDFALDRHCTLDYLLFVATCVAPQARANYDPSIQQSLALLEREADKSPLTEGERYVLFLLRAFMVTGPLFDMRDPDMIRLNRLIGDGAKFFLVAGEAWSDALNEDLGRLPSGPRQAWVDLLRHLLTATSARPSAKWLKGAEPLVKAVGRKQVIQSLERWLPLVSKGRTVARAGAYVGDTRGPADTIQEENATVLRGMMWMAPLLKEPAALGRLVSGVALSAYKKVPGVGPRAVKVGNAAVYALSQMASPDAVGQLAMLKVRVRFGTAQKEIEKAFTTAAAALGLPREEIEEMGVPSYGLEEVGVRREVFAGGDYTAELRVEGREVALRWLRADGKPQKSIPAKVKAEYKQELKELQTAAKDIAGMLPAQAARLDSMFLPGKRWDYSTWRERYLDHPLVGTLARRLIWSFGGRAGIWYGGAIVDVEDRPIEVSETMDVSLWHPLGLPAEQVLAWRQWLQRHEVRQPFKQAHREVYLLTDAERRTQTYSNRFAGHILRQHQFHALCAARGWKNKLRLMVDDAYEPASKTLPAFGLRAEYWIEGIGDDYGTDTTESGSYLRLSTDQVRFYRVGAATNSAHAMGGGYTAHAAGAGDQNINEPIALEEVPALVLSEIMRDVDLFVGVASIGNDPAWQDGGRETRYQTYWHDYSFGELSETARTRREVLAGLVPRLKIAGQCELNEKFLVVRGRLRTYKIHLGSGNILMEPNDQYLCIVPGRGQGTQEGSLFLPFEGDGTLSVILSKAFLLAEDDRIKDPTIVRQIR